MSNKEFKYEINEEFGTNIISEGGNSFIALRKISWNGREEKIDIRKYMINSDGNEVMGKGVSLSYDDASELADQLVQKGFGNPEKIINSFKENKLAIAHMYEILESYDQEFIDKCLELVGSDDEDGFDASNLFDGDEE